MPVTATAALRPAIVPLVRQKAFRINSIDLLRGLVMIVMALDHTRDFFHVTAWSDDPLNLATTSPVLFLTRFLTHFCAPVFVFLAGSSIYFQSLRKTKKELSLFLLKRGLWLVFVEIVIFNFAFSFNPDYNFIGLQTIWSIGISMMILAAVIWLPFKAILAIGLCIVLGHNSLDFYEAHHAPGFPLIYSFLHHPGVFPIDKTHNLFVLYPFLPWVGLMMMGYCFGKFFMQYEGAVRRQVLIRLGIGLILFFILLRATNLYGDPSHWAVQSRGVVYTVLSFINVTKYPPSLLYMCVTIGPALLFLAAAEGAKNRLSKIITVYGKVPFLYYVLHFYLIHFIAMIFFFAGGHTMADMKGLSNNLPLFIIPGQGQSLGVVYLVWLFVVASLYPVCKWFSRYKQTHKQWWLSYL